MKINGLTTVNPDYGYETTIEMPFTTAQLGNGKLSHNDESNMYDTYTCKCNLVLSKAEMLLFFELYDNEFRGALLNLSETIENGFYPFTPAISTITGLDTPGMHAVYLSRPKNLGAADVMGKSFEVEFTFLLMYTTILYRVVQDTYIEGGLSIGDGAIQVQGIRFPEGGFNIDKEYNVFPEITQGGSIHGCIYPRSGQKQETEISIICNEKACGNIIYRLLYNHRANDFKITTGANYFIFGLDQGDNSTHTVKLSSGKIKVKHLRFNEFSISLKAIKV